MKPTSSPEELTVILGGGLSGLYAGSLLRRRNFPFVVLEARPQLGGRIRSARVADVVVDLGPSWFWPELNPRVNELVTRFGLKHHPQFTDGDALLESADGMLHRRPHVEVDPRHARRLVGGMASLVTPLAAELPTGAIRTNHRVEQVRFEAEGLVVRTTSPTGVSEFTAGRIICALPPRLVTESLACSPPLPGPLQSSLRNTPTWMAGEAKFFAIYDEPFWRSDGLSGSMFSPRGPLAESHDASPPQGAGALLGFLVPGPTERRAMGDALVPGCLGQLARSFGPSALRPRAVHLMDWSNEPFTATLLDRPLDDHPDYGFPEEANGLWEGRFLLAGTEVAPHQGGYLEGALVSAAAAVSLIP